MVVEPRDQHKENSLFLLDEFEDLNLLALNETNLLLSLHSNDKKEENKEIIK